ncbi:tannase/feruloyl esterase family alpha/beta hydrolase [Archangium violaceum]|uniref:tannase/feruloyl esterase family alpha/beta hydrolase n=1 Tax=Archangium violaceum TaxID=83451 RepID=UPI002B2C65C6|nr:tannase/feruloyl esterase family alpha/beta hydrolase [Archangium violaceum]
MPFSTPLRWPVLACAAALLSACDNGGGDNGNNDDLPQLSPATGATLSSCTDLASKFSFSNTTLSSAEAVAAGTLKVAGMPVDAHCLVKGEMNRRTGAAGQSYAIGFEMRLPNAWNGRFFYQANGGTDGSVITAIGEVNGGSGPTSALQMGFAVLSSDAGHNSAQNRNGAFGVDFQARLDYGYQAAATLTPMAKALIATAYGKGPDRSYFGGCSNGGRHTFVAMTRMPEQYDGYLAGAPGYRLPLAAIANIFGAKQYASVATNPADISTGFTSAERATVTAAVVARCDALDGASDGLIQDTTACQATFDLNRDVPTCSGERDGSCLSAAQKIALAPIFSGAVDSKGTRFYSSFPFDSGLAQGGTAFWEFLAPLALDSGGVGVIWGVPPADPVTFNGPAFALSTSIDDMLASVAATNATYTESALSFMLPVEPTQLGRVKNRGAKIMVYHGVSDPIFSSDDTTSWYEGVRAANGGDASNFARFYRVPGMGHCSGGPSTDQFDMLTALVNWVEKGQVPDTVVATARGAGNAAGVNPELPSGWSATRSRPLCPYPQVARLKTGSTDLESADSFACQ